MENFNTTAVFLLNGNYFHHFGIRPELASLYGEKPEDIQELIMKISDNQQPNLFNLITIADYWGWYDNKKKIFTMIYPKRFLLEMCFTYGMKASEIANQGKAYRLEIITSKKI